MRPESAQDQHDEMLTSRKPKLLPRAEFEALLKERSGSSSQPVSSTAFDPIEVAMQDNPGAYSRRSGGDGKGLRVLDESSPGVQHGKNHRQRVRETDRPHLHKRAGNIYTDASKPDSRTHKMRAIDIQRRARATWLIARIPVS